MTVPYIAILIGLYILRSGWTALLLYHIGVGVFLILDGKAKPIKFATLKRNPIITITSVLVCALSGVLMVVLWEYMGRADTSFKVRMAGFGLAGWKWYLFIIYFSTVHPFIEELYWRRLLASDQKYLSPADIMFAGYHVLVLVWFIEWPWVIAIFFVLAGAGRCWRWLYNKYDALAIPLLSHAIADLSIVMAAHYILYFREN